MSSSHRCHKSAFIYLRSKREYFHDDTQFSPKTVHKWEVKDDLYLH